MVRGEGGRIRGRGVNPNCPFGAIRENGRVFEIPCDGCGACVRKFPDRYRMKNVKNADILEYRWGKVPLITAELEPGRSGSGKIITKIRHRAETEKRDLLLVDAAAGIGCPAISSVRGADVAVLVINGTPTEASDAERVVDVLNHFQIPFFFVVNRWDLAPKQGKEIIREFAEKGGECMGKIPYIQELMLECPLPAEKILEHLKVEGILKKI